MILHYKQSNNLYISSTYSLFSLLVCRGTVVEHYCRIVYFIIDRHIVASRYLVLTKYKDRVSSTWIVCKQCHLGQRGSMLINNGRRSKIVCVCEGVREREGVCVCEREGRDVCVRERVCVREGVCEREGG